MRTKSQVKEISAVRKVIGKDCIKVLHEIFDQLSGTPPSVDKKRFRADNHQSIEFINKLEHTFNLITCEGQSYRLHPQALPIIEESKTKNLFHNMQQALEFLQDWYNNHLDKKLTIDTISKNLPFEDKEILESLYYLSSTNGVYLAKRIDFPYCDEPYIQLSEDILGHDIYSLLTKYYNQRYIKKSANHRPQQNNKKPKFSFKTIFTAITLIGAIIIGLANFTEAITTLKSLIFKILEFL